VFSRAQLISAVQQIVAAETKAAAALGKSSKHISDVSEHKIADLLRANLEGLEGLGISSSNKDLLALHNGAWGSHDAETKRISQNNAEGEC